MTLKPTQPLNGPVDSSGDPAVDTRYWSSLLSELLNKAVTVRAVSHLSGQGAKAHGLTDSVEVVYTDAIGTETKCLLKTPDFALYGQELAGDYAREVLWRLESSSWYENHTACLAAGAIANDGHVQRFSMPPCRYVVVESFAQGEVYAQRLADFPNDVTHPQRALDDARLVCSHMVRLHRPVPNGHAQLYRRMTREILMDCVFRLIDSGDSYWASRPTLRTEVEHRFLDWRLRLLGFAHRLRIVHNDFHPWNIIVDNDVVRVIGAKLPGVGDPANDLAALLINYVWHSYANSGAFEGLYRDAYGAFWQQYLALTEDTECASVFPPFFALRLLVLLNPTWYPRTRPQIIARLEQLLVDVLAETLDPLRDIHKM